MCTVIIVCMTVVICLIIALGYFPRYVRTVCRWFICSGYVHSSVFLENTCANRLLLSNISFVVADLKLHIEISIQQDFICTWIKRNRF